MQTKQNKANTITLNLSQYTRFLHNIYIKDGEFSAEEFVNTRIAPHLKKGKHVIIEMNNIAEWYTAYIKYVIDHAAVICKRSRGGLFGCICHDSLLLAEKLDFLLTKAFAVFIIGDYGVVRKGIKIGEGKLFTKIFLGGDDIPRPWLSSVTFESEYDALKFMFLNGIKINAKENNHVLIEKILKELYY